MLDERFVILGFILNLLGGVSYTLDTLRGKAKPNRVSWFLWTLIPLIAYFAELDKDVGIQSLMTLSVALAPALVLVASFLNKQAYWELHKHDYLYGTLAILGLILWQVTGEGNLAIIFSILADVLACIPTIIKSFHYPETENSTLYGLVTLNSVITILTIDTWNFATYGFPIYIFLSAGVLYVLVRFKLGSKIKKYLPL